MRSRYTAFLVGDAAYLEETWHPRTRPDDVEVDAETTWHGLEIIHTDLGDVGDSTGVVEFRASWSSATRFGVRENGVLHERSRFARVRGRWSYLDGDLQP